MIRPLLWLPLAALSLSPALAQDAGLEKRVMKLHAQATGENCQLFEGGFVPEDAYLTWTFSYEPRWAAEGEVDEITLIRVFCGSGAYNVQHAYYWVREYEGLQPLAFATPTFVTEYADDNTDAELTDLSVTGFSAQTTLVNSGFDPETLNIAAHSYWRGIGDASSFGIWTFREGEFALVHYEIDASYDGEINPETVVDYLGGN